jgi:alpha-1,2-mannosyltransferase
MREELAKKVGNKDAKVVGFFHPFCDAGGGGEKVLFQAISAIQSKASSPLTVIIYSASDQNIK